MTVLGRCVLVFALAAPVYAGQAPGWRRDGTGKYPAATPVTEWSPTKNVVWKTKMPLWSNASPVLVGDKILVCAEPASLVCVNAADGAILWQKPNEYMDILAADAQEKAKSELVKAKELRGKMNPIQGELRKLERDLRKTPDNAELKAKVADLKTQLDALKKEYEPVSTYERPGTEGTNGYTSSTPVSDGKNAWVLFGNGVAACYDLDGNRKWAKLVEKTTRGYGHSASPLLLGDKLFVHIQSLTALNKDTGETAWHAAAQVAWGTPIAARIGKTDAVITPAGDVLRAADGTLLAKRVSNLEYCAPVIDGDVVYFVESGGKAVKLAEGPDGALTATALWQTKPKKDRYYASPVVHDGLIYAINQKAEFSVIDAKTGEVVFEEELKLGKGTVYPSICLAGDLLFISSDNGTTLLMKPGRKPEKVGENTLEPFRSSLVFAGKRMYVRARANLYCIGE